VSRSNQAKSNADSVPFRPLVEKINKEVPQYSRIVCKEMILIVSHEKPLPIAAKGTVTKAASLALYEKEIEDM
jgi:adenylyl- and sulfurtransferase ThiI